MEWWLGLPVGNENNNLGRNSIVFNQYFEIYRTDVGVHSMDSPAIVFLQKRNHDDSYYDPKALTYLVNEALIQKGVDLRYLFLKQYFLRFKFHFF